MRFLPGLLALALPFLLSACDECAGTPSCHGTGEISYGGQFIEHKSGAPVGGVSITFARQSGVEIAGGTLRAVSDAEGFFALRAGALQSGIVFGELQIVPPEPHQPYTIPDVTLESTNVRGNGGNLGRLVVNPYLLLVGHVRDRKTLTPLTGVTVTIRRTGGGRVEQDSMTFVTDFGGQFSWEPGIVLPGTIDAVFEINAPGYPRAFFVPRAVPLKYRDLDMSFIILPVGSGFAYSGRSVRRGSGEHVPGVTVEFRRTGGIGVQPEQVTMPLDVNAAFSIPIEPLSDGTVFGQLTVRPPPAFPVETTSIELRTSDDDVVQSLGFFRYGAQVFLQADLRDADTGQPLAEGTPIVLKRTGGLPLAWPGAPAGDDVRSLNAGGRLTYNAPTPDSGGVQFDLIVRLPAPFAWDTIRNVNVPARYSDTPTDAGILSVRRRTIP